MEEDTIACVALRNLFSFLFQRSSAEERVAAYVIREHERGRNLAEILEDHYVQNRLSPQQLARLLDRPEVIQALGNETADAREALDSTSRAPSRRRAHARARARRRRSRRPRQRSRST